LRDQRNFLSYFAIKDLLGVIYLFTVLGFIIIYVPNFLGHPDNYIEANHMVTPLHIVPEWYFLPFYAILRSVPSKLNGVILMFGSLLILLVFPFIQLNRGFLLRKKTSFLPLSILTNTQSSQLNIFHTVIMTFFVVVFVLLGWLGGKPAVEPYTTVSLWLSVSYFGILFLGRGVSNAWHFVLFYGLSKTKTKMKVHK